MDGMSYWEMIGGEAIALTPEQSDKHSLQWSLGLTTSDWGWIVLVW